ncbi:RloB domain-containing protein [Lachnospiraceae bacterium]|nr:RloB domain-containing protein [Lachnospiraceae bacterium]
MGTDDLFKKKNRERKKRKFEYRSPKANSFLIVTEGKRTEPFYFKGIQRLIQEKVGGRIDVVSVPVVDIYGEGCSTGKLIEMTEQIVKKAKIIYQNVWVVFDRDDFDDFDQAIKKGMEKGYKIAWSNQSFEYWIYLHFNYSDSGLHRDEWNKKLNEMFQQYNLGDGKYRKNYEDIYNMLNVGDGVNHAIRNAKRRMGEFDEKKMKPSMYDPGTTVYKLVEELRKYLTDDTD